MKNLWLLLLIGCNGSPEPPPEKPLHPAIERHFEGMYEEAGEEDREVVDDHVREWGWKE